MYSFCKTGLSEINRGCDVLFEPGVEDVGCEIGIVGAPEAGERPVVVLGRIGFITGHINWGCALERLEGYKIALAEYGVPFDSALVVEGSFTTPSGYTGADTLLSLPNPPSAIFASNDGSAYGVIDAFKDRHLRIPDDISVICFDDIVPSAETHPPLTSVRQPLEQIGRVATKLLLDAINDPDLPETIIELPTQLIIRQSCCPPHTK